MPHYKDGTEAKIGDTVKGHLYNTSHEVQGVVVSITPSVDSCNCMIAFAARQRTADHQSRFEPGVVLVGLKTDYCAVKDLELLHRDEAQ